MTERWRWGKDEGNEWEEMLDGKGRVVRWKEELGKSGMNSLRDISVSAYESLLENVYDCHNNGQYQSKLAITISDICWSRSTCKNESRKI